MQEPLAAFEFLNKDFLSRKAKKWTQSALNKNTQF